MRVGLVLSAVVVLIAAAWPLGILLLGRTGDALLGLAVSGFFAVPALAVIWLGVFVVHVIVKGVRLMNEGKP